MVDYHVDRPGVEALQGVELTGTNRSDILNYAYASCLALGSSSLYSFPTRDRLELRLAIADGDPVSGVHSDGAPPVPIPNTAVKPASANDSRTAVSLESRSAPDY